MAARPIRIIGIDPGLRRTGWGIVDVAGSRLAYVACGLIAADLDGALAARIEQTVAQAAALGGEPAAHAAALKAMVDRLGEVTMALAGLGDPERTMANATVYLEAAGHVVVAWMWLEQLVAADGRQGDFYDGKRAAGRYFFRYELPRTGPQLDLLESLDRTTLEMWPDWF